MLPAESVAYLPAGINQVKTAKTTIMKNKIVNADGILKRCFLVGFAFSKTFPPLAVKTTK